MSRPGGNPGLKKFAWKKGKSGNPKGKPKGTISFKVESFKQILDRLGAENLLDDPSIPLKIKRRFFALNPITKKTAVMHVVYQKALEGKDWATRYIADYSEGKPKEFHEIARKNITIDIDKETSVPLVRSEEILTDDESIITDSDNDS